MSVWKSVSYRDDILHFVGKHLPIDGYLDGTIVKAANFRTEFEGELNDKISLVKGHVGEQMADRPLECSNLVAYPRSRPSRSLHATLKEASSITSGIDAVYKVISQSWDRLWDSSLHPRRNLALESQLYLIGMAGGYHTSGDVDLRILQMSDAFRKIGDGPRTFVKELHVAAAAHKRRGFNIEIRNSENMGRPLPEVVCKLKIFLPGWEVFTFRATLILRHFFSKECIILMQKDIDRIEKFVIGCHSARVYGSMYGALKEGSRRKFMSAITRWQNLAVEGIKCIDRSGEVCRAFDIAYHTHLAKEANDISDRAYNLQVSKYRDGNFDAIIPLSKVLGSVHGLAFKERLEVLQQYKIFPANDFDSYNQATIQSKLYEDYANIHEQHILSEHHSNILRYHKWLMVVAFHARHGHCPGVVMETGENYDWAASYPYVLPSAINYQDVIHIDFNGEFVFNNRKDDCLDLIKDKAICPASISNVKGIPDLSKLPVRNRSQLLDALMRPELPNLDHLADNVTTLNFDVKADDKPEAKKPNGRWFFEAGTDARLLMSEYEDSNADYARHFPGSVVGLDANDVKKKINAASAPMLGLADELPLYISFDIEKFSPALHPQVCYALDAQWAEAYGKQHILEMHRIVTSGKIHYVKGTFHHEIDKSGSDFEGFAGRRNTMYHCAVMGYVINTLRKEGVLYKGGNFVALIDDGLLRLSVKKEGFQDNVQRILQQIEDIYRCGSMQISWDKTFVSSNICVFLNEVRYIGRSVTPGMKAILRISDRAEAICPSLPDDLMLVASTARGAITAGATPSACYAVYIVFVCDAIKRWGSIDDAGKISLKGVLKAFLPIRMGGLSVSGLMALAGSVVHDDLAEGLGVLRIAGFRYPEFRGIINNVVNDDVMELGDQVRYSNPHGVRSVARYLAQNRGPARIKRFLLARANLPAIAHLLQVARDAQGGVTCELPKVHFRFPVELRERIWDTTPEHVIDTLVNKFLRARSALVFVPFRILAIATISNKTEAREFIKSMR